MCQSYKYFQVLKKTLIESWYFALFIGPKGECYMVVCGYLFIIACLSTLKNVFRSPLQPATSQLGSHGPSCGETADCLRGHDLLAVCLHPPNPLVGGTGSVLV